MPWITPFNGIQGVGSDGYVKYLKNSDTDNNGRVYVNDALQVVGDSYLASTLYHTGITASFSAGYVTLSRDGNTSRVTAVNGDLALIAKTGSRVVAKGNFQVRKNYDDTNQAITHLGDTLVCHHNHALFNAVDVVDSAIIFTLPARSVIMGFAVVLDEKFVATDLTALIVTIGLAGDPDGYLVAGAMNLVSDALATEYRTKGAYWTSELHAATITGEEVIAYVTATGANLSALTAGQVTFYVTYYTC